MPMHTSQIKESTNAFENPFKVLAYSKAYQKLQQYFALNNMNEVTFDTNKTF